MVAKTLWIKDGYSDLHFASPNLTIWKITISTLGKPIFTETGDTFVAGGLPFATLPEYVFAPTETELCLVDETNQMWLIRISDVGIPSFMKMENPLENGADEGGGREISIVFHPSYIKFYVVSPNQHLWDISIDNDGNPVRVDTGKIYNA